MSVILDALRRARQGHAPAAAPARPVRPAGPAVPAGLRVGTAPRPPRRRSAPPWPLVAGALLVAAAIWAGVRFGPGLIRREAQTVARAPEATAAVPPAPTPAPPAAAEAPGLTEMIATITQPPAVAPRAMPTPRPAGAAPARPRPAPPRPLPATPAEALTRPLTTAAVTAAAPAPAVNHFELAVRYHSLGNFEQALKHYLAVLEAEEFNVEARNNLGLLYHDRGLVPEAVDQFRRAIAINPEYLKARSNLAVVLMKAGRLAEARAELRAASAIDARSVDLLVNQALVEKADRRPQAAQELLFKALGLQPTHAVAHYNMGLLYEEGGNAAKAADHYEEFLKYAGPEHGTLLSDVRTKVETLMPRALPR